MDNPGTDHVVDAALVRARAAQEQAATWPQHRVDDVVAAVGWWCYRADNVRAMSATAHRGTGLGDPEDLFALHRRRVLGTLRDMHGARTVGVLEADPALGLRVLAKPVGVVALVSPATAPCSAVVCTTLQLLKTRNAVVCCPNPAAQDAVAHAVALIRAALVEVGAPPDLVQRVGPSGRPLAEALMSAADLVVVSGGAATVRRAYASGTPAIGAGVGNPTVVVDETADLAAAAERIVTGSTFNNGTSCSSESNVLVAAAVAAEFRAELRERGVHLCDPDETARLRRVLWPDGTRLDRSAIGRPAAALAERAGIEPADPDKTTSLVAVLDQVDPADPLLGEKLSPVFTLVTYQDFDQAVAAVDAITRACGSGHSCGIHTTRADRVAALAERVGVARVMVNQSTGSGNSGSFDNGLPFTSIVASGSWGGCAQSENVTWRHFMNRTTVSHPIPERRPDEETVFGVHWDRHGV
ncbi:aldehyde dehydrogenase family protein [Actinophytocola xanthii]|uniref:Succinate-semialdehyde dehydrogenase n=1 Tax=Actinophytocola xanthii TaxID=1912961 RepID=A0A1Q8CS82_9PSEU|nr:aldehyde dehydrogenase family protein [Actinophytocola xanthii]OLF17232.1 succinate-semialdehyde dehydrogenase [Actinophytocola xanthii]